MINSGLEDGIDTLIRLSYKVVCIFKHSNLVKLDLINKHDSPGLAEQIRIQSCKTKLN